MYAMVPASMCCTLSAILASMLPLAKKVVLVDSLGLPVHVGGSAAAERRMKWSLTEQRIHVRVAASEEVAGIAATYANSYQRVVSGVRKSCMGRFPLRTWLTMEATSISAFLDDKILLQPLLCHSPKKPDEFHIRGLLLPQLPVSLPDQVRFCLTVSPARCEDYPCLMSTGALAC